MSDHLYGHRLLKTVPKLEEVIERHLPGDNQMVWHGAISIFQASETPDEFLGFIDKKAEEATLRELETKLEEAISAMDRLNKLTLVQLSKAAIERYGEPPRPALQRVNRIMQDGISDARIYLEEAGDKDRSKRRAAAVVGACRKVYGNRTGEAAPRYVRDHPQEKPAPFTAFVRDVFQILGVRGNVSSALDCLRRLGN